MLFLTTPGHLLQLSQHVRVCPTTKSRHRVLNVCAPCEASAHLEKLQAPFAPRHITGLKPTLYSSACSSPPPLPISAAALPTRESLKSESVDNLEPAEPLRPDDEESDEAEDEKSPLMNLKQQAVVAVANAALACTEGMRSNVDMQCNNGLGHMLTS